VKRQWFLSRSNEQGSKEGGSIKEDENYVLEKLDNDPVVKGVERQERGGGGKEGFLAKGRKMLVKRKSW